VHRGDGSHAGPVSIAGGASWRIVDVAVWMTQVTMDAHLVSFGLLEMTASASTRRGDRAWAGGEAHKKASQPLRDRYGHTPLSLLEPIPWDCRRLIVGTGADGALPIDPDVVAEARRRRVKLVALPTDEACALLTDADLETTNAILVPAETPAASLAPARPAGRRRRYGRRLGA
jgi:hypothetical protein